MASSVISSLKLDINDAILRSLYKFYNDMMIIYEVMELSRYI